MRDHNSPQLTSFTAKIGNPSLRFVVLDEPDEKVRVVLGDLLAVAGYPEATRHRVLKAVPAAELRTIDLQGCETPLVEIDTARELMMRAADLDLCPSYQIDVFEVIASYARDELVPCYPCTTDDFVEALREAYSA